MYALTLVLLSLSLYLALSLLGCTKPSDTTSDASNGTATGAQGAAGKESRERRDQDKERKEARERKKEPLIVPAGTTVTVSLGSAIGSKLSQTGQTFNGSVAKDVLIGSTVAIPQGATVSGTSHRRQGSGKIRRWRCPASAPRLHQP